MFKGKYDMVFVMDGEVFYLIGGFGYWKDLSKYIYIYYVKYDKWLKFWMEFILEL